MLLTLVSACGGGDSRVDPAEVAPAASARVAALADATSWTYCTWEGGTCTFSGTRQVRFGTPTRNVTRTFTGSVKCTTSVFGDPAYGTLKSCWIDAATPTQTPTTTAPSGGTSTSTTGWSYCTWQGGTCSVSGTRQVRYGVDGSWVTKTVTGSVACTDAVFGDPAYGKLKACWSATTTSAGSTTGSVTPPPTGGTSSGGTSGGTTSGGTPTLGACVPSGQGRDYQVGPAAGQLASLDQVPWESLAAGDTVRIFYSSTPYRGKILLAAKGTASAPVRVCGVAGASGQRPIIDGAGAVARRGLSYAAANVNNIQEARALVLVDRLGSQDWGTAYPTHIQIDGLELRGARPGNTFVNSFGASQAYVAFGGCIWIERGHNITIANNDIHDCTNGIFSKSSDGGDFLVTKNLRIAGNSIYGNGIVGDEHMHNTYVQSVGVIYEFNRYGVPRAGSLGNALKDRSVGTVVRFNRIEGGAHSIDLVEAEDFPVTAMADPAYRTAYVYGNQIVKSGDTGSLIHYGGDHYGSTPGANWGESLFRRGTMYFFHNTVYATGSSARLFQLATTLERAEVWNNVFVFAPTVVYPSLRQNTEIGASWTPGGVINFGKNWISAGWADSDPWHPIPGTVTGTANLISSGPVPVDLNTFVPLAGSAIIDAAQENLAAVAAYSLGYQLGTSTQVTTRAVTGSARDLGAVER